LIAIGSAEQAEDRRRQRRVQPPKDPLPQGPPHRAYLLVPPPSSPFVLQIVSPRPSVSRSRARTRSASSVPSPRPKWKQPGGRLTLSYTLASVTVLHIIEIHIYVSFFCLFTRV
jgi:hypothetical protein